MKQIIIVKPKTLSAADKQKLSKEGNLVIEHPIPSEVLIKNDAIKHYIENGNHYVYTNCYSCGDRIYVTQERLTALKAARETFYCSHGHPQCYK